MCLGTTWRCIKRRWQVRQQLFFTRAQDNWDQFCHHTDWQNLILSEFIDGPCTYMHSMYLLPCSSFIVEWLCNVWHYVVGLMWQCLLTAQKTLQARFPVKWQKSQIRCQNAADLWHVIPLTKLQEEEGASEESFGPIAAILLTSIVTVFVMWLCGHTKMLQ